MRFAGGGCDCKHNFVHADCESRVWIDPMFCFWFEFWTKIYGEKMYLSISLNGIFYLNGKKTYRKSKDSMRTLRNIPWMSNKCAHTKGKWRCTRVTCCIASHHACNIYVACFWHFNTVQNGDFILYLPLFESFLIIKNECLKNKKIWSLLCNQMQCVNESRLRYSFHAFWRIFMGHFR